ncbi:lysosomal protective protein-like [Panonychus citri]|uniref:lysosomal protective protein-like n=1 Tax=Panonychus citri TaxID=50023 RepID=UPI0023082169|nr:lysosomal protective protein-like [Panonychus citri]
MFLVVTLLFSCSFILSGQAFSDDRVTSLPGLSGKLDFNMYSGYLDASPGTHLHYVFVESENDPAKDPLLLWLNGGPGCSSLLGFFTEQGPFRLNGNSSLDRNPYAWNKVANVIFLESPSGVGYSYSDSGNYTHDDDSTSLDALLAIKSWFNKFQAFKYHAFYLTGESYAGVYIPTLSVRLLEEPDINYVGFAIGNGYLDQYLLGNSMLRFAYYHGLLDSQTWNTIVSSCCNHGDESPDSCNFATNTNPKCVDIVNKANTFINKISLNPYAIYEDCKTSASSSSVMLDKKSSNHSTKVQSYRAKSGWHLIRNTINTVFHKSSHTKVNTDNEKVAGQTIPCVDDTNLINYLSRSDVRDALKIPSTLPDWTDCSETVSSNYKMQYPSLKKQVIASIKAGKRGLIYNGDTDMVCDFLGDEWFSDQLGFKQIGEYEPWYVNNQVAGFVKHYQGFAYATIRGSGHTVPEYRPAAALYMIEKFLARNKLV